MVLAIQFSHLFSVVCGFCCLVAFSVLGEWLSPLLPFVIPAPLLGMLSLFLVFVLLGRIPVSVERTAKPLLAHMSLFFIPAIMGIWHFRRLLAANWLTLTLSIIITTLIALAITAKLAQFVRDRSRQ